MTNKINPTITYDMTWEELEEQTRINKLQEEEKNFIPRIKKYV